jgi:plastocyanin
LNWMRSGRWIVKILLQGSAAIGLVLSLSACKGFSFLAKPRGTETVSPEVVSGQANIYLQENGFHPQRLTVKVGTTITWVNKDPVFHSVVEDNNLFQSALLAIGQSFSYTFNQPGTYSYYCGVHGGPGGKGMSAVIIVVP